MFSYRQMLILPVAKLESAGFPLLPEHLDDLVAELCAQSKKILLEK